MVKSIRTLKGGSMKKWAIGILFFLLTGCAFLDNSGEHKPVYLTDPRYVHYAQVDMNDPAPWPYCKEYHERMLHLYEIEGN
jgi:hypothetical protein